MTSGCSVGLPFSRLREGSCFFNVFFFISELSKLPLCFILFIYLDFFFLLLAFCRSPRILRLSLHTPPSPTPTHLSFTLITQLLLGNVVPAGPGISPVAPATEHMMQSR